MKLNLGCGFAYIPGCVNIDSHERSVPDLIGDVSQLPHPDNSIDSIEAAQLIEHFDLVHCRYVLAEWYRILAPSGRLVLETPDLSATVRKLASRRRGGWEPTQQWLFGIDSPGLRHKSGITFGMLKSLLEEVGFVDVVKSRQLTHTYEPGMRVECTKPDDPGIAQVMAHLRRILLRSLRITDSFVLIPLEERVAKMRSIVLERRGIDEQAVHEVVRATAPSHPIIPIAFVEHAVSRRPELSPVCEPVLGVLKELASRRFHERAFTLWIRSAKSPPAREAFAAFNDRLGHLVEGCCKGSLSLEKDLAYVLSLEPTEIPLLDLTLVSQCARKSFSQGVRAFSAGSFDEAERLFAESDSMLPGNPLVHWNLARMGTIRGKNRSLVLANYAKAAAEAHDLQLRRRIRDEENEWSRDGLSDEQRMPVPENAGSLPSSSHTSLAGFGQF